MENNQKNETKKLPGFYIALCCCVLAIGAAGYFTERYEQSRDKEVSAPIIAEEDAVYNDTLPEAYSETGVPSESPATEPPAVETVSQEEESAEVSAPAVIEEADYTIDNPDLQETVMIPDGDELLLSMPVNGAVLAEYSDKLEYNDALGDWRTHDGLDIACEVGASIHAAADGTVDSIENDAGGISVTLSHKRGYSTVYRLLDSAENLKEGVAVKAGDVIGTAGKSAGENITEPHLHFEIQKDGECIDPRTMFP